ncbi:MAG: hypothetical protein NUW01_03170, partial [Gemmatimonadaceae bacterium]|nr:hypothetical protein [Gemmatimonadaceae bacterium]
MSPFDISAQAAQIRSDISAIRKRSMGALSEDRMARGNFSSEVAGHEAGELDRQYGLQEASELERLRNDASQRSWQMQMEQQRFDWDKQRAVYGQGAQRYGNANEIQAMQEAYGGGGATGARFGGSYGRRGTSGGTGTGGGMAGGASSETSRRDASSGFYRDFGKWPTPAELDAYMKGTYTWNA